MAVDAVVEEELASALQVSVFPEILFTKAGKILHRDKGNNKNHVKVYARLLQRPVASGMIFFFLVVISCSISRGVVEDNGVLLLQSSETVVLGFNSRTESREDPIPIMSKQEILFDC